MNNRLYFLLAFLVGCANTGTKLENIPLVWKPTTSVGALGSIDLTDLENAHLQVDLLADNRENRGVIGQNIEKTPRKVSTPDDVSGFVTDHMKSLISRVGIDVVDSGATAILKGDIKQFFVEESETYEGNVRLRLSLTNPAGEVLWTGTIGGASRRFGRSYRAENYYEALSDSLIDATYHLVQDAGFRKALSGK